MGAAFNISVSITPPDWLRRSEYAMDAFLKGAATIFRSTVFKFLEMEVKTSRVKTGRMKSAWTPFMDRYGHPWQRSDRPGPEEDTTAIAEGKEQGQFGYNEGNPWNIAVINSVEYASIVEEKWGMSELGPLAMLVPRYEEWFEEGFKVLESIAREKLNGPVGQDWQVPTDLGAPEV